MKAMRVMAVLIGVAGLAMTAQATNYLWQGGTSTNFGDAGNWTPAGTSFATDDNYRLTNQTSITTADGNFSVGGFELTDDSSLRITSGSTFTINENNVTKFYEGSLIVDGTFDAGGNRLEPIGAAGKTVDITVNGDWINPGNSFWGKQVFVNIDVNGDFLFKGSGMGSDYSTYSHVVSVNTGGLFDVYFDIIMKSGTDNETAIYLNGGTLNFNNRLAGLDGYDYSNLTINGDDGIIFTAPDSKITLDSNRVTEVNGWISDGALSSTVGDLQVSYDADSDLTTVIPEPATIGLLGAAMGGLMIVRRRLR
ncbi:PEP-CTERM sorting domain-containing protein [Kiritimatiella glycovorans]|uniref:PEP-CTERM protein-sorting domain-containing protein n=1 Tax=Kiritimatiella glycovorans TaxID=1307763 RepID=A0A0G3EFP3_9BACT|nr:PEP-CTERM sorting domain-containing protein [Kiritimatiella glycovorans]AKJ65168.1 hypothetical protein L21SP4_01933 [Kiritimatiella glycovorans]